MSFRAGELSSNQPNVDAGLLSMALVAAAPVNHREQAAIAASQVAPDKLKSYEKQKLLDNFAKSALQFAHPVAR
ncbi:hypothetical protein [Bradyrhizobium sp. HKCCYLS20291]|uniref:hypothetical protein n=1 Tax=Bradyrhizobium sp. HKCCYLS20291 TaxID=3420766 RepID=UPI003EB8B636